jgi:hypothetical protein
MTQTEKLTKKMKHRQSSGTCNLAQGGNNRVQDSGRGPNINPMLHPGTHVPKCTPKTIPVISGELMLGADLSELKFPQSFRALSSLLVNSWSLPPSPGGSPIRAPEQEGDQQDLPLTEILLRGYRWRPGQQVVTPLVKLWTMVEEMQGKH